MDGLTRKTTFFFPFPGKICGGLEKSRSLIPQYEAACPVQDGHRKGRVSSWGKSGTPAEPDGMHGDRLRRENRLRHAVNRRAGGKIHQGRKGAESRPGGRYKNSGSPPGDLGKPIPYGIAAIHHRGTNGPYGWRTPPAPRSHGNSDLRASGQERCQGGGPERQNHKLRFHGDGILLHKK